ncbi:MAG: hypothetical protein QXI60_03380 [Thermofilaceae archaeon]
MARVPKSLDEARANFEAAIPVIPGRYEAGIRRSTWADAAASDAAEANFAARMQVVLAQKLRAAGIKRAGDAKWREGAVTKGTQRIGPGIQSALDDWQANFGKVYQAVLSTVRALPPRGVDPMQNIDRRLKPVVQAAVRARVRGGGS